MFEGFYLQIWNMHNEKVFEQSFGDNLQSAVEHASSLVGILNRGKGSVTITKRYRNSTTHEIEDIDVLDI